MTNPPFILEHLEAIAEVCPAPIIFCNPNSSVIAIFWHKEHSCPSFLLSMLPHPNSQLGSGHFHDTTIGAGAHCHAMPGQACSVSS